MTGPLGDAHVDKPQVNIFALCEKVIRDQSGRASLLGIFDTINFPAFPATFRFFLFVQVNAPPGSYQIALYVSPADEDLPQKSFEDSTIIGDGSLGTEIVGQFEPTFGSPGLFEFRLYIDGVPALTRPFHVRQSG